MKVYKKLIITFICLISVIMFSCKNDTPGCVFEVACNYNPSATEDDGTCIYAEEYYDCSETCINDSDNDGICDELEESGCTILAACNYDSTATDNDDSCLFPDEYYDCEGICLNDLDNDGICDELEIIGCNDENACNYDPNATDVGPCEYIELGYNCDGSINTFYSVDELFGFGVTFNEIVNAGFIPEAISISQILLEGCDFSNETSCENPFLRLYSDDILILETGYCNNCCSSAVYENLGFPIEISTLLFSTISIEIRDYDILGSTLIQSVDLNPWNDILNSTQEDNSGNINQSPTIFTLGENDGFTCPLFTFTHEIIWE